MAWARQNRCDILQISGGSWEVRQFFFSQTFVRGRFFLEAVWGLAAMESLCVHMCVFFDDGFGDVDSARAFAAERRVPAPFLRRLV